MEPMKLKIKEMFAPAKKSIVGGGVKMNVEDLEITPGGMLVQKRDSGSNQTPISIPTIKVTVKFGSSFREIHISSTASFGELKKMLSEHTGLHQEDQKLIYKKKERDSKDFLDVAGVKNGSKLVLMEDTASRERRCLETLKNAKLEKASKSITQIMSEIDKLSEQVTGLEATASSRDGKVYEKDVNNLIELLMSKYVVLDGIAVKGDLNLQKRIQERRVRMCVETLDKLNSNGKIQMPKPMRRPEADLNQRNFTQQMAVQMQRQQSGQLESVVVTTKWETFD
ncbi:hypothetical protein HS088_TW20G00339 [Tripterygium wilfordii]|uniref:Ubiquitin-like domain-containing protein n=2 Tax=Tripterygium wilfordii TaxID=458696 RepID=A0A7J7C790_TRIWF|nr:hypothetical protein HS088_TW20G00339 [Tripterygium wilfordii]